MARKKELSEQEKVAEILKRANVSFDPAKAEAQIALNTRCKRCGRTLSSLERITFEDRCAACMQVETKTKRDGFAKKYILLAFAFICAIVFGGYCANSESNVWLIVGVAVSALVTGVSLGYVFYTNIHKILPSLQAKFQIWAVFFLALGVAFIIALLTYLSKSWILYIVLMLAVGAYVVYIAYGEYNTLKERANMIEVYNRKVRDKEYVESITEAIEARAKQEETEAANPETVVEKQKSALLSDLEVPEKLSSKIAEILKEKDSVLAAAAAKSAEEPEQPEIIEETPAVEDKSASAKEGGAEDSGDFSI